MGALSDQLARSAREIGQSIPQIIARFRLRLESGSRSDSALDEADFWLFSVSAKDHVEGVMGLSLLDPEFEIADQRPVLGKVIDWAIEASRSIPRDSDEAKLGVLENLLDAAASGAILLEGRESFRGKRLFEAGLRVRQGDEASSTLWKPDDEEEAICRALLRLFHLGRYEDVLVAFEDHLQKDTGVFHEDPAIQMAVTLYLRSATKCERGKSVENAEFGSKVWRDLTVFWWLAAKSRVEYSLQSYRLYALLAAFDAEAGRRPLIILDELIGRMERDAKRFLK